VAALSTFASYASLFASGFIAASLFPASSEALLIGLQIGGFNPLSLLLVASAGNTLGSVLNWWLGRNVLRWQDKPWFPVNHTRLESAQAWFRRVGSPILLLAWLPVVGDALTLAAGMMRTSLPRFVLLVALGKTARYAVLMYATHQALAS